MNLPVKAAKDGITLTIYVQPSAAASGFCGVYDGMLKARIAAKPQDGAANRELCKYLSSCLRVPCSAITLVHGASGRKKLVHIAGDPRRLTEAIAKLLTASGVQGT